MKNKIVVLIAVLMIGFISVYATNMFNAKDILFVSDKTTKDNLEDAINELYELNEENNKESDKVYELIPSMSSDSEKGYQVSASSFYQSGYPAYYAVDNDLFNTYAWVNQGQNQGLDNYFQIIFPNNVKVYQLYLYCTNDNSVTLQGSLDGINYENIKDFNLIRNNITFISLDEPVIYKSFRLVNHQPTTTMPLYKFQMIGINQ